MPDNYIKVSGRLKKISFCCVVGCGGDGALPRYGVVGVSVSGTGSWRCFSDFAGGSKQRTTNPDVRAGNYSSVMNQTVVNIGFQTD